MLKAFLYINNKQIGMLRAVNDGTGTSEKSHYNYEILTEFGEIHGKLKKYDREKGAWELVRQILDKEKGIDDRVSEIIKD